MAAGDTQMTITGNLVDDPELRFTPAGQPVAKFRVASTPRFLDKNTNEWKDGDSLFLTCNVWRQAAENVAESLTRGMRVIVSGRLRQRSYETKEGEKRTVYEIEVDDVGPSLRNASAKVNKVVRSGAGDGSGGSGGGFGGGQRGSGGSGGRPAAARAIPVARATPAAGKRTRGRPTTPAASPTSPRSDFCRRHPDEPRSDFCRRHPTSLARLLPIGIRSPPAGAGRSAPDWTSLEGRIRMAPSQRRMSFTGWFCGTSI